MSNRYLVFGSCGGIGSALCRLLSGEGHRLAVAGRDPKRLDELATELEAVSFLGDATDWSVSSEIVGQAAEQLKGLDGVAVCIGSLLLKPAHLTEEEELHSILSTNLTGPFGILKAVSKAMLRRGGCLVFVSSAAAQMGMANHEAVAAAKAGLEGLTRSAAASYAPRGIRVNCVAPGLVETPMTEHLYTNDRARSVLENMHPLGRLGRSEDVARAIGWLLCPEQSWISGQVIGVDGGLATMLPRVRK